MAKPIILSTLLIFSLVVCEAQTPVLDNSFGNNGVVITPIGMDSDNAWTLALQPDGKVLLAGESKDSNNKDDIAIVRYNKDGSLDSGFGNGGTVVTATTADDETCREIELLPNGKFLVLGHSSPVRTSVKRTPLLLRYNSDGSIDSTFANNGLAALLLPDEQPKTISLEVGPQGSIYIAGNAWNKANANGDFFVAKYLSDGRVDTSFNGKGWRIYEVDTNEGDARIKVLQSGKIIIAGATGSFTNFDIAIMRLNADGSIDPSFGTAGKVILDNSVSELITGIEEDPITNKISLVGGGYDGKNFYLMNIRLNANGSLDNSFGNAGISKLYYNNQETFGVDQELMSDGSILCLGYIQDATSKRIDLFLSKLDPNGNLDLSFGSSGWLVKHIGSANNEGLQMAISSAGELFIGGYATDAMNNIDFAIIKYKGLPSEIEAFSKSSLKANIYPNPVKDDFNLVLNVESGMELVVNVISPLGRSIKGLSRTVFTSPGQNIIHFDLNPNIEEGVYLIEVLSSNERIVLPFVKL